MLTRIKAYFERNREKHEELNKIHRLVAEWQSFQSDIPEDVKSLYMNQDSENGVSISLQNDDLTPLEYVVFILEKAFNLSLDEANRVASEVHNCGVSVVVTGVEMETAKFLVAYLRGHANSRGYPLDWNVDYT